MEAGTGGKEVSNGVGGEAEAEGLEALAEPGGAGLFAKGRRRNGGDGELEVRDVALVAGKPFEETVDARVGAETLDILGERGGLRAPGLPANPRTERHGRTDGTRGREWGRILWYRSALPGMLMAYVLPHP